MCSANDTSVGLISMPWAPPDCPPIALGIIKSVLLDSGIPCDCFYLNHEFYDIITSLVSDPLQRSLDRITYSTHTQIYNWLFSKPAFDWICDEEEYLQKYFAVSEQERYLKMRDQFEQKVDEIAQRNWSRYFLLGFNCSFYQLIGTLALSKKICEQHDVKIILGGGGLHAGNSKEILRECPWIEAIFLGETEYILVEAIERLRQGKDIHDLPGVFNRTNNTAKSFKLSVQQFNDLPLPNYDEFYNDHPSGKCNIEGSRGCWWADIINCSFCGLVHHNKFKTKNKALEEVSYMRDRYGITEVEFCDLVPPKSLIDDLCLYEHPGVNFVYNMRVDSLDPCELDKLNLLRQSGTKSIFVGIDSLHPKILKLMAKGHTVINALNYLKWGQYYNIRIEWFLLFGTPNEEGIYYDEICQLMKHITHFDAPSTQPILIAYNSPYHKTIGNLIPTEAAKYIFPERFDPMQMSWEFELTDWPIIAKQIENYKHIRTMIDFIEKWRIQQPHTSLCKISDSVYDNRNRNKKKKINLTKEQSKIIDFCYIPQKMRLVTDRFTIDEIQAVTSMGLIVESDRKLLAVTTPECSIKKYELRFQAENSS